MASSLCPQSQALRSASLQAVLGEVVLASTWSFVVVVGRGPHSVPLLRRLGWKSHYHSLSFFFGILALGLVKKLKQR